jgi:hypothetical protein
VRWQDGEMIFDWSGLSDDTRKEQICPATFLALPTAARKLIVLHDAECFHRVPLAALLRRPTRTIARVEFHGCSAAGEKVHFAVASAATGNDVRWQPWSAGLPPALGALCTAYARASRTSVEDALRAYVAAEMPFKAWLERQLLAGSFELKAYASAL